jgi:hypothetical protein
MAPGSAQSIVSRGARDGRRSGTDLTGGDFARDSSAYELAAIYGAHDVISPGQTRGYLTTMLDLYVGRSQRSGVGQHLLSSWPTSFR